MNKKHLVSALKTALLNHPGLAEDVRRKLLNAIDELASTSPTLPVQRIEYVELFEGQYYTILHLTEWHKQYKPEGDWCFGMLYQQGVNGLEFTNGFDVMFPEHVTHVVCAPDHEKALNAAIQEVQL